MRWLPWLAVLAIAHGCAIPRKRDCFDHEPSRITYQTPEPPPLVAPPASVAEVVTLSVVARGLREPVAVAQPPGDSQRLFVAERGGRILILREGAEPIVFVDLSDRVTSRGRQQGLLGMAFHPELMEDEKLYVNFTDREHGATRIVELRAARDAPDRADMRRARQIVRIGQPWPNNNGGHLAFGPDGLLYVGMGDGGGRGDPRGHAQLCSSWRGKMLRIDVDAAAPAVEVVQVGLRDPWRYSFDRRDGHLYIADVGEDGWEMLYAVPSGNLVGHNFGWNIAEGSHCFRAYRCDRSGFTVPILEYGHGRGCAIIGGHVYRGRAIPELDGVYFFADHCSGMLRSVRWSRGALGDYWDWKPVLDPAGQVTRVVSFGEDQAGELYLISLDGTIWKLARQ